MKIRLPDSTLLYGGHQKIITVNGVTSCNDVSLSLTLQKDILQIEITADHTPVSYAVLEWRLNQTEKRSESVRVLGDSWERAYGDMKWDFVNSERQMPWYFLVSNGSDALCDYRNRKTECFGVKVRPSAFCYWMYSDEKITLTMDIRCGTQGVRLNGRYLHLADVIFREYQGISAFESGRRFCSELCSDPILPKKPVLGFNNWYYAYGKSSEQEILKNAAMLVDCCRNLPVSPYMVIDDGWQINAWDGPWNCGNERFPNMQSLAKKITSMGVHPGLWIRPLYQSCSVTPPIPKEWRLSRCSATLDPSHPQTLEYIAKTVFNIVKWGYRLIKYDFTTYDIFGQWGKDCNGFLGVGDWAFFDRSKTTAEIIVQLYRTIKESAGDAVLIGCNTVSHLCAGLVELNRTGDDISGREWEITKNMGVNTLAFRAIQNRNFYMSDADCVAITEAVPWKMTQKWLQLVSNSTTPLFVSWDPKCCDNKIQKAVCKAFERNAAYKNELIPVDWMENQCPTKWLINGNTLTVDWTN